VINVLVLQNHMDLLRGELHSCSEPCVTSTQVEKVNVMTEEETVTVSVIKTEPTVSCVWG